LTGVSNQKVNVIGGYDLIEYRKTEALLRFENPAQMDGRSQPPS